MAQPGDFGYTLGSMAGDHRSAGRVSCGNFKMKFMRIENVDDWNSIYPNVTPVLFACATNTSDNDDIFGVGKMNIESTATNIVASELKDTAATFSSMFNGLQCMHEGDKKGVILACKDADECYTFDGFGVASSIFDAGNEAYNVNNDRCVELNAVNTDEDGYLIVLGR